MIKKLLTSILAPIFLGILIIAFAIFFQVKMFELWFVSPLTTTKWVEVLFFGLILPACLQAVGLVALTSLVLKSKGLKSGKKND